jgi:ligand-binding sensor domain-containing protein/two-component sensor histidine kinase
MKRWLAITSHVLLITSYTTGQQLIFKTYTVEDGLVSNPVLRIYQDSKGFIWIGTMEGLSKYDGHKFTNYTTANGLSYNMVNDMYESTDGKLYVTENNGCIDILQNDLIVKKAAFKNIVINQFYKTRDNRVIAATDTNGLYEFKNGTFIKPQQSFPGSTYYDLTELNDSLFIGGHMDSIRILNKQFEMVSEIKLPGGIQLLKIYRDSKNKVWAGTDIGLKQVSYLKKKNQPASFVLLSAPFKIPVLNKNIVEDILEDDNGNYWIATSHGLVKIEPDGDWQLFTEKDGLPSAYISILFLDKEKNIWIGTTLGLAKLVTKNETRIYGIGEGLASIPSSLLLPIRNDNDLFLTGTDKGMQLFNTNDEIFTSIPSQNNATYKGFVQNSRPVLLFRDHYQFGRYDPVNRLIVNYHLTGPSIGGIVQSSVMDANGIIFTGTQSGLIIYSGKNPYREKELSSHIIALLIDKKGYLWAGMWDKGLVRIHYTTSNNKSDSDRISLSIQDYSHLLPDKNVRSLFEDSKGNIWVGTRYKGVVQLGHNSTEPYAIQHFDLDQGLIRTFAEDSKGCIWLGSYLGIDKLIPAGKGFRVFNFSRANNFFAYINGILPANNRSLWFITNKGLVNIIDDEMENTPPEQVYITSVALGDTSFNYNSHHTGRKVYLKHNQNQATFSFSAPVFINEKQILYSYRLWGSADTSWSKLSNLHTVSYANLQPGNYRFEVRTIGWNEKWGAPASFLFMIRPPYWQTWWFYSLISLLILLLFYSVYLYRIRQLRNLHDVRDRIATDLHDDIGATLTNINMLSEISRKNLEQPREAEKFLNRITEEVTDSGQALNDIIWSVNTRNDSVEETLARMRRYAAELFDNSKTTCHLNLDESVTGKKLNMEQRRDVYLIYKESLNNIYKHALANNVWIDVQLQKGKLHLKMKDDGKGFDPSMLTNRNGLKNIRTRTSKWKGSVNIETAPGNGTLIEIIIPLAE